MVNVLVIPDGAAQPPRAGRPTALEEAWMPVLAELAAEGQTARVATTRGDLPAGSENGIPTLLGVVLDGPVGRGWVDAAAYGVEVADGLIPWRADVIVSRRRTRAHIRQSREVAKKMGMSAVAVGGHRLVLQAPSKPGDRKVVGMEVRVWDPGTRPTGPLPCPTTIICGPGAAAGCGRLLGAEVVIPERATGDTDSDLAAKARAAQRAIADGWARVVVHVGGPDEAAHRRDQGEVVEALERMDAELLGPLRDAVADARGMLAVCPDHGTDPLTGEHDGTPVPALRWWADGVADESRSMSERAAAAQPLVDPSWLFARGGAAG